MQKELFMALISVAYAGTNNVRVTRPTAGDVSKLVCEQSPLPDGDSDANDGTP